MNMISIQTIFITLCLLISAIVNLPICHDNIPFSIKLARSPLVVYGDIIETSTPLILNNVTKAFNITFLVKCTLKGRSPTEQTIIIEHSPPENPICFRTLVNRNTYVFFLNQTNLNNSYKQMSYHELSFSDDATVEILKRTCGIQLRPFHKIIKKTGNEIDDQCPIVSIGCL